MTTITTAPRRPLAPWMLMLAAAALVGVLAVSGARLTWDVPTISVESQEQTPAISAASRERAAHLAAARRELTALRQVVRQAPTIGPALRDRMQLLAAVGDGHVPVQALQRSDDMQLQAAVRAGHVPAQALHSTE